MFNLKRKLLELASRQYHLQSLKADLKQRLALGDLQRRQLSRNEQYFYCVYFFDHFLQESIKKHRRYFNTDQRGFGEDAFHAMWFLLFQQFHPRQALEIGVYRGQTVTLWKLLGRHLGFECNVGCVSPFNASSDSVSQYGEEIDYYQDLLQNHRHFELSPPETCRSLSTTPEARSFATSRLWDMIYIDGNHDYEIARQDWEVCSPTLAPHGIIVLDDSALHTDYRPPIFATAGHPGPSKLAGQIDSTNFREIFAAGHNRVFQRIR